MMRINTSFPFYYNNHLLLVTFFFLLLLHFSSWQVCPTSNGLSGDSQLLISFQKSLPPTAQTPSWDPSFSPCDFNGVSCKNSRVSSIDLSNYNLGTNFPKVATFLLSLDNLYSLLLKNANISGAISSSPKFSCTSSLISLDLSGNAIPGPISDISLLRACSGLASLNLSRNSIGPFTKEDVRKGIGVLQGLPSLNVLDVSYNSISGDNVVPWIMSSSFPELNHLSLKGNRLTGNLPEFTFKNLGYLDLSLNNFSAELPLFTDCSNLQHLDLSSNSFSGDVGLSLSTCPNLAFLNLSRNSFTGGVPALPSSGGMQFLYLQENHFSGVLPPNLPDWCTTLVELNLSSNNFTGTVPETLAACSALELLDISNNNFSGELPVDTVLLELVHLKTLVMSFNNFIGGLSDSFSKMVNLGVLDVSSNNISGVIPDGLCQGSRSSLRVLYLQNNLFGGTIPDSLSNCSKLESLDLSFNYLTGTIPPRLGFLPNLRDVVMWLNELHGEIPQEFMHLQSLETLILDFNYLTGSIPDGLSNCSKLNWISLSSNGLSGEIPPSFGRLANLEILKLGNNSLSGGIPAELGDCQSLLWLDLNTNLLSGTIPPALFKQSGNTTASVTGQRYVDIKNDGRQQCQGAGNLLEFEGIRWAQLDRVLTRYPCKLDRVYRGIIQPPFSHNGSMLFLDLSYNKLNGVVPKELGSMYYLIVLNFGHNDLSGPIPKELGELRSVAILDLSYNRLNGTIPEALTGLSFGDIDLSNNNLSGKIPESNPFDTIPRYRFVNNSGLCGYPLGDCTAFNPLNSHQGKPNSNQAYLAGSVAIGLLLSLLCAFGLIFFAVETRKKRKKQEAVFEAYMENHSNSTTAHSVWKIGTREALNISITTFDQRPLKKLTFADLLEATNGFHNDCLVGSGGFGDVYKAQLKDGSVVAIKKLIHISGQGDREFTAEMETIGRIKHRNLVPLLGYCKVGEERLLVYEYMRYGSLEDVLRDRKKIGIRLNWPVRRRIAVGAAKGLSFLHQTCNPCIIHRDMKSSNVLLDENLEARVSDFGMARYMNTTETHLSVSILAGTPGYVPPEYYQSFRCSTRGDVYSYGVVLLELLTGRQPTDSLDFGDNNLVGWVKQHRKMKISDVFDPILMKEGPSTEIELLQHLEVAVACLNEQPERRPTMFKVLAKLMQIQASSGMDSCSSVGGIEMSIKEGNELNSSHL